MENSAVGIPGLPNGLRSDKTKPINAMLIMFVDGTRTDLFFINGYFRQSNQSRVNHGGNLWMFMEFMDEETLRMTEKHLQCLKTGLITFLNDRGHSFIHERQVFNTSRVREVGHSYECDNKGWLTNHVPGRGAILFIERFD
ncbi:hypothetical protein J6590_007759 [Homalodisca vitripennis]|nr:hypothetical protein J6590_007759 [Homalodisca vitripennis]